MSKRVLVADDSQSVREVIKAFLILYAGAEICGEAADGLEALERSRELEPDLVVLDYAMPILSGAEVAAQLKSYRPDLLIILFTMYGENVGKAVAETTGIDAVLCKPDGITLLAETASRMLNDREAKARAATASKPIP